MKKLVWPLLLFTSLLFLTSCSEVAKSTPEEKSHLSDEVGRDCIVYLRDRFDNNGDPLSLFGTIEKADSYGIILQDHRENHPKEYWISSSAISYIDLYLK